MSSYRITSRPSPENLEEDVYDVEERQKILFDDKEIATYWSFLETFYSFDRAEEYVQALMNRRRTVKRYN